MKKKIFFVCYGGGHAKMIVPVVKDLREKNKVEVIVLALTTAASVFQALGIECLTMSSLTRYANHSWRRFGESLVLSGSQSSLISFEDSVAYHGINYAELVETFGETIAHDMYLKDGRQSFFPMKFFSRLLVDLKPDLVVATNSPRSERACIEAARLVSIPAICLVDMFALQEVKWIASNEFANKVCVLNENVKQFFMSCGRRADDVIVTGNPAFDGVNSNAVKNTAANLLSSNSVYSDNFVILYASQPEPEIHPFSGAIGNPSLPRNIESSLREYVRDRNGMHLIVRYHPSENIVFKPAPNVSLSASNEQLHPLLHVADLVVVTASTVGLEAHLASRHVISIDCSIFTADAPFSKMGISDGVESVEFLHSYLDKFFINYVRQRLELNLNFSPNATDRVIQVINSFVRVF